MSDEKFSFRVSEFTDNSNLRCPVVLVLDTSTTMSDEQMSKLNTKLKQLHQELLSDPIISQRVEIAIITFGPAQIKQYFSTVGKSFLPIQQSSGAPNIGEAIEKASQILHDRKNEYKQNGISYFRPWIFLFTNGTPTDTCVREQEIIKICEVRAKFYFCCVGIEQADIDFLARLCGYKPVKLKDLSFGELFTWLTGSIDPAIPTASHISKFNNLN